MRGRKLSISKEIAKWSSESGLDKRVPVRGRKLSSSGVLPASIDSNGLDKRVPVRGRKLEKLDEESQQEEEFR